MTASTRNSRRNARIAIAIDHRQNHAAEIIIGFCSMAESYDWEVAHVLDIPQLTELMLHRVWRPDGIISLVIDPFTVPAIARLGIPRVIVLDPMGGAPALDEIRIGALAAEHLVERGYSGLVLGFTAKNCRHPRGIGFLRKAAELGVPCLVPLERRADLELDLFGQIAAIANACATQPHPLGLFCWNDGMAVHIINSLRGHGLSIPDEIGVLGCGNEPLAMHLASTALSSVDVPFRQLGLEAAHILHRRMNGSRDTESKPLPPSGIAARSSTDLRHQADPLVAKAVAHIAKHIAAPIGAEQIAAAIGANRRTLERRFRQSLRRTILEEIHRQRTQVACMRLEAGEPVASCAASVGWSISTLDEVFRNRLGMSPAEWRKRKIASLRRS